jgi:hypothetical protein
MAKKERDSKNQPDERTPFQKFENLARKIVRVPKSAIQDKKPKS